MGWHPNSDKDFYTGLGIGLTVIVAAPLITAAADATLAWLGVTGVVASSPQAQQGITTTFNALGITDTTIMVESPGISIWHGTTTGTFGVGTIGFGSGIGTITGTTPF